MKMPFRRIPAQERYTRYTKQLKEQWQIWSSPLSVVMVSSLIVLLSACSLFPAPVKGTGGNSQSPQTFSTPVVTITPQTSFTPPVITLRVSNCPTLSINWDKQIGTQSGVNKVQQVTCGNLENNGIPVALVGVRYYTSDSKLDLYIYDNLAGAPNQLLAVKGLLAGQAQISPTNTIMTAQLVDQDPIGPNLFREYQWNPATRRFAQIVFPGIFPDVTHYQAEHSHAAASNPATASANAWRTEATEVVRRLAQTIFHWDAVTMQLVTSNNVTQTYLVNCLNQGPGGGGFTVHLLRLDGVVTNIFEVGQLTALDTNTFLSAPTAGAGVGSPVVVRGVAQAFSPVLGETLIYDDTFAIVGNSGTMRASASKGYVNFSQSIKYQLNAPISQEGVVAFFETNQNNTTFTNQICIVKVLLAG